MITLHMLSRCRPEPCVSPEFWSATETGSCEEGVLIHSGSNCTQSVTKGQSTRIQSVNQSIN